ncbi:hypothetical protein PHYSODRAFT_499429 [Phytophthora sojae]|uniref:Uncharacterized protein n=1 Tax=Phytophthora sojae (strain P6497) TaxID=1094619 RepID=G4ZFF7_PHYSP|nr:hypothetical protein PHYSODRAFT_499429 [Phytophthora sojae]EGZ17046.1 hypothetical protein PHYSODRAFT_499429 [Phytophthora sojae]|eukprot:XP_009526104.1 hypothetical protein PHYSODRAFT_499429 [Phytophthora sojae]
MPHASFFPTAKEVSSGVQWFKDHPVLAAAAATAVSVITYLNALELPEAAAAADTRRKPPPPARRRGSPSLSRKGSGAASDGKLSAAVSWCDEHGGSLTQVFEDDAPPVARRGRRLEDSDSDDEARDDVAERFEDGFRQHRALTDGLRKSVTTQQLDAAVGAAVLNDSEAEAAQTESPQWGWYVPITPPQDQFHPAGAGRESAVVVPCRQEQLVDDPVASLAVKSMRRTTSGQIP